MKSLDELKAIRDKMKGEIGLRSEDSAQTKIVVGLATCGIASGARPVLNAMAKDINERNLENVVVSQTGCLGLCQYEPMVEVFEPGKEKVTYINMTVEKALEVIDKHIINGKVITQYTTTNVVS